MWRIGALARAVFMVIPKMLLALVEAKPALRSTSHYMMILCNISGLHLVL